jgi:hypothetical protein
MQTSPAEISAQNNRSKVSFHKHTPPTMMRSALALYLVLFLFHNSSFAQTCSASDTTRYHITVASNQRVTIWPQPENITEKARIVKEFDLNGDGIKELLIDFGVCGNNVCVSAIYSPDTTGTYTCILKPDYWWHIEASAISTNGWKNLMIYEEPYYRFAGQEGGITLVEFIEPAPLHYAFDHTQFAKRPGTQLSSQL